MSSTALPLPFYPGLAQRYGAEHALMLAVLIELVGGHEGQVTISQSRLYQRLYHLERAHQIALLQGLVVNNLLEILPAATGTDRLEIKLSVPAAHLVAHTTGVSPVSIQGQTNSVDNLVKQPISTPVNQPETTKSGGTPQPALVNGFTGVGMIATNNASNKTPYQATSRSGARERDDELARIFAAKEFEINKKIAMTVDWQPSHDVLRLLEQNQQITRDFACNLQDEFIVYAMEQGRTELPNVWDQKFLKYVKRAHVQQSGNRYAGTAHKSYAQHEENRYLTQEKRRQLTAQVLDIHNTDW